MLLSGAALFILLGVFPVGYNMLVLLEREHPRPLVMPEAVDGIIVLGGAFDSRLSEIHEFPILNGTNAARILTFLELAKRYPAATLVFSGGSGDITAPDAREADQAEILLQKFGIEKSRILMERDSRNTDENVRYSKQMLQPEKNAQWLVVTSASHMPRTMAIFRRYDWAVQPYPTAYRTDLEYRFRPFLMDVLKNFEVLNIVLHEYIGMIVYRFTGRIEKLSDALHRPEIKE